MRHSTIPFADTKAFSPFFLDYISQKESLKPFYSHYPDPDNFNKLLTKRSFSSQARKILVETLREQYKEITKSDAVELNIQRLGSENTFTVTTGHQLNIFTGPLYFIYKIVTVVNTCRELEKRYPAYHFVPVYWMASEDHDYEEIKSFRLDGKKYIWETSQQGAVGRFETKDFSTLLNSVPGDITLFRDAYLKHKTLAEAVRYYVNALFGDEGVVVVDGDNRKQKSLLQEVMKKDIIENVTVSLVNKTNQTLENLGYKTQIFCRDINFFYLDKQVRSRIEKQGDTFNVVDTDLSFSYSEMEKLIDNEPEKLSPNVILRPLYQELILPNVAYVGGPAEVIYWLQLKAVFDFFKTPFPILMPRNFAMVIEHHVNRKFGKTGLALQDLFEDKNYLFNHWVLSNSKHDLTIGAERNDISTIYENLRKKAESIDKTLSPFVAAEGKRVLNSLEKIEKKILRAEKRLHGDRLRQIAEIKDILFPNGNLQERTDNFLNFYMKDKDFVTKLIEHLDPFDFNFNVLTYEE